MPKVVILLAIIIDSGDNRADKSKFMNHDQSTPLSDNAKQLDEAVKQRYLSSVSVSTLY